MDVSELIAREGVRDCIAKYNAYGDSGRVGELMKLFADDAIMEMDGERSVGREAISNAFRDAGRLFVAYAKDVGSPRDAPVLRHFTSTIVITVESPTAAHATLYYQVLMYHGLDHWGRYEDDFRLVDGKWLITHRREWVDGAVPGGMGARQLARLGRSGYTED